MKKIVLFLLVGLCVLGVTSCEKGENNENSDTPNQPRPRDNELRPPLRIVIREEYAAKMNSNTDFAIRLFQTTADNDESTPNVFVSPLSVNMALGMLWNGATGENWDEMQQMLGNAGYTPEQINEYDLYLRKQLSMVDPSSELIVANAIWTDDRFPVRQPFIDVNEQYYDAKVEHANFASPLTLQQINDWCNNHTKGKIPEILEELSPDAKMVLANALYFKGGWNKTFKKENTTSADFLNSNGSKSNVRMMRQQAEFLYNENEDWRALQMQYGNGGFSMVVLLPQTGKTISALIPTLNTETWNELMDDANSWTVNLTLPRFKAEYTYQMEKGILQSMGMRKAFIPSDEYFTDITPSELFLSQVIHKTYIGVDEEGSEAAGVTAVMMEMTSSGPGADPSKPIEFRVDQPFVYAIRENSTGTILFIGKIEKM